MKLKIEIELGNAAFDDPEEISRVLKVVSEKFATSREPGCRIVLSDKNGNRIGTATQEGQ